MLHPELPAMACFRPDWPAPAGVCALQSTRVGGVSSGPFASLNLGNHVGDDPGAVSANRLRLFAGEQAVCPVWLQQVHGTGVLDLDASWDAINMPDSPVADATMTHQPGRACVVMTADCLPVLFCDRDGSVVAAAHAGWRGLCAGVLEATVAAMRCRPENIMAWLGPAIGPQFFEVGEAVRAAFIALHPQASACFNPGELPEKWLADIFSLAHLRLTAIGVKAIFGGGECTFSQPERYFSYRRDGQTGRMATAIWLNV